MFAGTDVETMKGTVTGVATVAAAAGNVFRTGSATCSSAMTVGNRSRPIDRKGVAATATPTIEKMADAITGANVGTTTAIGEGVTAPIGQYHCSGKSISSSSCSELVIPESISAITQIYLLKQPGTKPRTTLHL